MIYKSTMNTSPSITNLRTNRITIDKHCLACVNVVFEPLLKELLSYDKMRFYGKAGRLEHQWVRSVLCQKAGADQLVFPVGCLQRVATALQKAGHESEIHDLRGLDRESLQVDPTDFAEAEQNCRGITASLEEHTEGLLQVARGTPRARAIGAICRLLSKAKIFIAAASQRTVGDTYAALLDFVGGEVTAVQGGNWTSPCRVVCGTFTSFDRAQASDWDVLIFEDGLEALGLATHENRPNFSRHRVYSFVEPGVRLTHGQQLELETLAGPIIHSPCHRGQRRAFALEVVFASAPLENLRRTNTARELREQLWSAPRRNATVAAVAKALATCNPADLWKYGLFLHEQNPFSRWQQPPRVTVLVDTTRHAEILAKQLPDWPVMARRPDVPREAPMADGWDKWTVRHQSIITAVRAANYKVFDADVIVMASGGPCPTLPAGLARRGGHVLIVDFDDASPYVDDVADRRSEYDKLTVG